MTKVTDDIRILVALRRGYDVLFHWYRTERPRFSLDRIEHPDGRQRGVAHTACGRLRDAGLIAEDFYTRPLDDGDWSSPYRMTDAGIRAAADMDIPDDKIFAAVKRTPPEKLDQARHRRRAK